LLSLHWLEDIQHFHWLKLLHLFTNGKHLYKHLYLSEDIASCISLVLRQPVGVRTTQVGSNPGLGKSCGSDARAISCGNTSESYLTWQSRRKRGDHSRFVLCTPTGTPTPRSHSISRISQTNFASHRPCFILTSGVFYGHGYILPDAVGNYLSASSCLKTLFVEFNSFEQATIDAAHLSQFISRTPNIQALNEAVVIFSDVGVIVELPSPTRKFKYEVLELEILATMSRLNTFRLSFRSVYCPFLPSPGWNAFTYARDGYLGERVG
jgi:hypothetical protein